MGKHNSGAWAGADSSNQDEGSGEKAGREDTRVGVEAVSKGKGIGVEALICTVGMTSCAEQKPGEGTEATNVETMAGS